MEGVSIENYTGCNTNKGAGYSFGKEKVGVFGNTGFKDVLWGSIDEKKINFIRKLKTMAN